MITAEEPGGPRWNPMPDTVIRITVVRADNPKSPVQIGDYFDIHGPAVRMPVGGTFPFVAMSAIFGVVSLMQMDLPEDDWLVRKPYILGPDADEGIVMKLTKISVQEAGYVTW